MSEDTVNVCPECDRPDIDHTTGGESERSAAVHAPGWKCYRCGIAFDTPNQRRSEHPPDSGHSKLREAGYGNLISDSSTDE